MSERRRNRPPNLRMPSSSGGGNHGGDNSDSNTSPKGSSTTATTAQGPPTPSQNQSSSTSSRPPLRWRQSERSGSRRFQYSTDDDENEVEADLEREYFEGYSAGLKDRLRRTSKSPISSPLSRERERERERDKEHHHHHHHNTQLQQAPELNSPRQTPVGSQEETSQLRHRKVSRPMIHEENEEEGIGAVGGDHDVHDHEHREHGQVDSDRVYYGGGNGGDDRVRDRDDDDDDEEEEEDGDDQDDSDNESTTSVETFTLRERQDAINITHPFGIKVWKPAVYKKIRSVQRIAEGDIHSTPGQAVTWGVFLGNILWTLLFGFVLMVVCLIASGCMMLVPLESARRYGRTFFFLGAYLWFPFGKFVELVQQDEYILEDEGEGRPLEEYERWQAGDVEYGRLFFEPRRRSSGNEDSSDHEEQQPLLRNDSSSSDMIIRKRRLFGRGKWNIGRILFYIWFYFIIAPLLYLVSAVCWFGVFSIPMAKVTSILASQLRKHPLALKFKPASSYGHLSPSESSSIILCTYRALGFNYYKYTIDGTNIFFINLMVPVLFVIFDWYVLRHYHDSAVTGPAFIFTLSLASVIPLAYFIGQAVASISAQSSMGMGAAINAFFSTIVEVFLYAVALSQGKGDLVEGSIVGSILAGVLFMPGLSMCAGAIKRKTQRYNPRSAGVSSTMLIFAIIGAFAPTIFYQIYGTYELRCSPCNSSGVSNDCKRCQLYQVPLERDALYTSMIQPFSNVCAILLFVSYVIGLWFTLRTHAAMIWATPTSSELIMQQQHHQHHHHQQHNQALPPPSLPLPTVEHPPPAATSTQTQTHAPPPTTTPAGPAGAAPPTVNAAQQTSTPHTPLVQPSPAIKPGKHVTIETPKEEPAGQGADAGGGHDAPNWSRTKSTVILLGATWLYAIIAEILVDTVDVVLQNFSISEKLLGITVFSLIPNTTEFLNAISFAMNGNIALSMEIGSAYALQVCLLQIPALVLYSAWEMSNVQGAIHDFMFTLVFPRWDLCMVILCVFLFSYIYAEGKSNYFKGSILILAYLVVMLGFYFANESDEIAGVGQLGQQVIFTNV